MTPVDAAFSQLETAISGLEAEKDEAPSDIDDFWVDCVRMSLGSWVRELRRDITRGQRALDEASGAPGSVPDEGRIASLEEALWRVASATDKIDAVVAIILGPVGIELSDATARSIRFRPSSDDNGLRLRELGTASATRLREARAAIEGERALLRRHQMIHSLAPLVDLHDLACFVIVHHRDGRIDSGGYELSRLGPERWDEGIRTLAPQVLFERRRKEATRAYTAVIKTITALAEAVEADGVIRVPQYVYKDGATGTLSLERPDSKAPVPSIEVEFVLKAEPETRRRVSCPYEMTPGIEVDFDGGVWRVIETADSSDSAVDQIAYCIRS